MTTVDGSEFEADLLRRQREIVDRKTLKPYKNVKIYLGCYIFLDYLAS